MKNLKMFVCLFLALAISLFLLTGCNNETNKVVPAQTDTGTSDTGTSDPAESQPDVTSPDDTVKSPYSDGLDDNGFWENIVALDYVEMFDYRGIEVPNDMHQISDETLQSQINDFMANYSSTTQIMDRAVVDGDTVNIDYVGSIDGVPFDGGNTNGMGAEVIIGETEYIDDFLAQLIGHTPGDTVNVEVTFPDDYGETSLQGKDALFVTNINYIVGESISAELTDAFVAENLTAQYGWATVAEMKETMRSNLRKQSLEQFFSDYFSNNVVVKSVPEQLMNYQVGIMMSYYQEYANYYGMEVDELLATEGINSVDELIERYAEFNTQNAKYYLIIQAIAEDAEISVSSSDIASYFIEAYGSADYSAQEAQFGIPYIKHSVLCMKVIDFLVENAALL